MAIVGNPAGGFLYADLWNSGNASAPALGEAVITPHDTNLLPHRYRSIRANGAGDIKYWCVGDDDAGTVRTVTVAAGEVIPSAAWARVLATDTTATGLVGYH